MYFPGVKVGDRWDDLVELYRPHTDDHVLMFHDAHMMLTYCRAGEQELVDKAMASLEDFVRSFSFSVIVHKLTLNTLCKVFRY